MNIFHRFTRRSLNANRSRTWVTIIGIVLSMALFTAVIEGAYSGQQFLVRSIEEMQGRWLLYESGLNAEQVDKLQPILNLSGSTSDKLAALRTILASSEIGLKGVEELETLFGLIEATDVQLNIELDLCLARGLNYYTGAIFEVKALDAQIGSITGGGRYDNLTGIFGLPNVSGVGISFGADRIYDVLTELDLFPKELQSATQILFATFGDSELHYALRWAKDLRAAGKTVEVYPDPTKMKKQMSYADDKKIPYVAIVGGNEMETNTVMLKEMSSGEQKQVTLGELCTIL